MDGQNQQHSTLNEDVEKSIRKKFHKKLFSRFAKAINEYKIGRAHV